MLERAADVLACYGGIMIVLYGIIWDRFKNGPSDERNGMFFTQAGVWALLTFVPGVIYVLFGIPPGA